MLGEHGNWSIILSSKTEAGRKSQNKLASKTTYTSKLRVGDPAVVIRWSMMEDGSAFHLGPSLSLYTQVHILTHTCTHTHAKCAYTETHFTHNKIAGENNSQWFRVLTEKFVANQDDDILGGNGISLLCIYSGECICMYYYLNFSYFINIMF